MLSKQTQEVPMLSDTISQAEQRVADRRARLDEAVTTGRTRLRAVVDEAVEVAEDRVGPTTSLLVTQTEAWRERALVDLERVGNWTIDVTRAVIERLPRIEVPVPAAAPSIDELVADGYDHSQRLLAWQRGWTLSMLQAARPGVPHQHPPVAEPGAEAESKKKKSKKHKAA